MIYIYNAGPLFSDADRKQRRYEGDVMTAFLQEAQIPFFLANPITLPFDNTKQLTSKEIFLTDYSHVDKANVFFFELATGDTGTMVELGNAIEKKMQGKALHLYPVFDDLRLQRNGANGVECPIGFNSYVVGSLTANDIPIYVSFADAFAQFQKDAAAI